MQRYSPSTHSSLLRPPVVADQGNPQRWTLRYNEPSGEDASLQAFLRQHDQCKCPHWKSRRNNPRAIRFKDEAQITTISLRGQRTGLALRIPSATLVTLSSLIRGLLIQCVCDFFHLRGAINSFLCKVTSCLHPCAERISVYKHRAQFLRQHVLVNIAVTSTTVLVVALHKEPCMCDYTKAHISNAGMPLQHFLLQILMIRRPFCEEVHFDGEDSYRIQPAARRPSRKSYRYLDIPPQRADERS